MEGEVEEEGGVFLWKLRAFSPYLCPYKTPTFGFGGRSWRMSLSFTGVSVMLFLKRFDTGPPTEARYSVGIRTVQGGTEVWKSNTLIFAPNNAVHLVTRATSEFLHQVDGRLQQVDITFTLELELRSSETGKSEMTSTVSYGLLGIIRVGMNERGRMTYFEELKTSSPRTYIKSLVSNLENLSLDWSKMLEDQILSDVKLKCAEQTFSAHRTVLAARSEVFAAMFRNKMSEKETGEVDVNDLDAQVLDLFLRYLYTGKIQGLPEDLLPDMYVACDKYAVHNLKMACSDRMIAGLTEGNCVSLLILADAHSDAPFRDQVVFFICGHEAILLSEDWSSVRENHKELAIEVYDSYHRRKARTSGFRSCVYSSDESPVSFSSTNLESLSLDWSKLLEDQILSDVKLKCAERTFSAHRAVLAARSEVFAAMFRNKMPESETDEIDVNDLDAQVLDLFLRYLYTGKIQGLSEDMLPGMYAACDKYAVHSLKKTCSDRMIAGLTEGNCVSLLTLADAHGDAPFRDQVIFFICGHEAILLSEDWSSVRENRKELAIEVYDSYHRRKVRTSGFRSCVYSSDGPEDELAQPVKRRKFCR